MPLFLLVTTNESFIYFVDTTIQLVLDSIAILVVIFKTSGFVQDKIHTLIISRILLVHQWTYATPTVSFFPTCL